MLYYVVKIFAWIIVKLFFPTRVCGMENINEKACIAVCNHYSGWDIPVVGANVPGKLNFLSKKELFKHKPAAFIFKKLGAIPVDRQNVSPATIKEVIKRLKAGKRLMLFPEGTRNRSGSDEMAVIKNGAAMFAIMANVPVVPMQLLKKPRPFRKNVLMAGEPLYAANSGKNGKEQIAAFSETIKASMESLRKKMSSEGATP